MRGSQQGRRSLLRRRLGAPGAAPTPRVVANGSLTQRDASQDASAGCARHHGGHGEAALPGSNARAPAVAALVVLAALCFASPVRADDAPPPASTTADAPPPDPYHPPARPPAPKQTKPAVVHSAPVYRSPVRTYTPPAPAVSVSTARPQRTTRPRPAKATHKRKARVVRHVAPKPKPVKVTFNPFANFVAASSVFGTSDGRSDRERYLWLVGFAFAVLAVGGLSLHYLSVRLYL